jgi:hypothetical protein
MDVVFATRVAAAVWPTGGTVQRVVKELLGICRWSVCCWSFEQVTLPKEQSRQSSKTVSTISSPLPL